MPLSAATLQALRTLAEQVKPEDYSSVDLISVRGVDEHDVALNIIGNPQTILQLLDLAALALEVARLRERVYTWLKLENGPLSMTHEEAAAADILRDLLKLFDHAPAPGRTEETK